MSVIYNCSFILSCIFQKTSCCFVSLISRIIGIQKNCIYGEQPLMAEMVGSAVVQEALSPLLCLVSTRTRPTKSTASRVWRWHSLNWSLLLKGLRRYQSQTFHCFARLYRGNESDQHKGRELQEGQEIGRVTRDRNLSISSLIGLNKGKSCRLSCSHVRRFEWFADCATASL